jgi:type IV pilus assembly protein PilM
MPTQPIGVWGIDLGQCGLKAIRLQEIDGQLVATAFDYVEHPKILSQPDADPDQLTREALDKFLSRNNLRGDIVAISVPGQSGLARFVKLPPVEEKKIADIVRFEAKQQIPFNLEEVVWDYQKIGSGTVTDGFAMETEIGLFAMKRDMVGRYLQHFKDVNVDVHVVQMAPLALCNYVAFDLLGKDAQPSEGGGESDKKCVVALDIGADSSNLVITDGERIIWQRPIPIGGNHFTRALTKDLKLTFAKAEHLKRNATKSPDLKKILASLKPVLNDFVGEVQRSLGYFTNTHRDAHIEYMIGLGNAFRLPGLQKFLSEKLQLEVRKLTKMERIHGEQVVTQQAFTENIMTFAVAYGLALQGLKKARLLTNLLPNEIRVERLIKAKKPFAAAAAAALLFGGLSLALSYGLEYRTYNDSRVKKAIDRAAEAKKKAASAESAFKAAKQKAKDEEDAVRTIVAGQFERDNWAELLKFISAAIPQPDGREREFTVLAEDGSVAETIKIDNIPKDVARAQTYLNPKAEQAYKDYLSQRVVAEAGKENGNGLIPGIENLIQLNIESVQGFFCDNLSTFWDQVKKDEHVKKNGDELVRPREHYKKNPEGSGWIIELHGWTYHYDRENFVKNTLLENLARLGIRGKKADAAPGATPSNAQPAGVAGLPAAASSDQQEQEALGPVINRISHVILFKTAPSQDGAPFEILDSVHAEVRDMALGETSASSGGMGGMPPGMAGGAAGAGGAGGAGAAGGAGGAGGSGGGGAGGMSGATGSSASTAPSRKDWTPLGEAGIQKGVMSGMPGMGPTGGPAGGQGSGKPTGPMMKMGSGGVGKPLGSTMPAGGDPRMKGSGAMGPLMGPNMRQNSPSSSSEGEARGPKRTEFVILFIWKEPTESDRLRNLTSSDALAPAASANASPLHLRPKPKKDHNPPKGN